MADRSNKRAREIRRRIVLAAVTFLVSVVLLLFNPFDLSQWGADGSGELARIAIAAQSPPPAQPQISVVLADDRLVDDAGLGRPSWPLPFAWWGDLISASADLGARVIFVDVMFIDDRADQDVAALAAAISYAAQSAQVYLAVSSPAETGAFREIHPALAALASADANVHLVSVLRGNRVGLTHGYPLKPDSRGRIPAALAIRDDACAVRLVNGDACRATLPKTDLDLWWSRPSAATCAATRNASPADQVLAGCRQLAHHWLLRLGQVGLSGLLAGILNPRDLARWGVAPAQLLNVPFPTIEARHLLAGRVSNDEAALVDGGVVMIGASFSGATDLFPTTVYGDVPGVYSHAAALQTLATPQRILAVDLGGRWNEILYQIGFVAVSLTLAMLASILAVLLGASRQAAGWIGSVVIVGATAASAGVEMLLLRVGPSAWGVVLGVIAVSHPLSTLMLRALSGQAPRRSARFDPEQ